MNFASIHCFTCMCGQAYLNTAFLYLTGSEAWSAIRVDNYVCNLYHNLYLLIRCSEPISVACIVYNILTSNNGIRGDLPES